MVLEWAAPGFDRFWFPAPGFDSSDRFYLWFYKGFRVPLRVL